MTKWLMGAISCMWRYRPHGTLLINLPHNTETELGWSSENASSNKKKERKPQTDETSGKKRINNSARLDLSSPFHVYNIMVTL